MIHRSLSINRHFEFFKWLQEDVRHFLPHDVLVAAWGDFSAGRVSYDVASSLPEIRTQKIVKGSAIDPLISALYYRWLSHGEQWFALNNFDLLGMNLKDIRKSSIAKLVHMKSIVVHGIRDKRSKDDCLYVFFDGNNPIQMDPAIMSLLLPHVDAALRRVECLVPEEDKQEAKPAIRPAFELSEREHGIISWVSEGKTNEEIALILGISVNTVKNHLKNIFAKMDVTSRAQAVAQYQVAVTR